MINPYKEPAEMPKEPIEMNDNERMTKVTQTIFRWAGSSILGVALLIAGVNFYGHWCELQITKIESTPDGRAAAEARSITAKAQADRFMFESMMKK